MLLHNLENYTITPGIESDRWYGIKRGLEHKIFTESVKYSYTALVWVDNVHRLKWTYIKIVNGYIFRLEIEY